jgi:nucleoside-diphosphate-sugar epimerase
VPQRALIIGGTGQIGRAVTDQLLGKGWDVTVSHRGHRALSDDLIARGARLAVLDREQPGALAGALGSGADAVIDTIAYAADHANQLLEIEPGVGSFVVISSSSVYRDPTGRTLDKARKGGFPDFPSPLKETQPTVDPGPETYSTRKIALERQLLDHARQPVTVLRPCAIHGPHSVHPREWWFVKRMLDGRSAIPLAYRGESRFHTSATVNIAALACTGLQNPGTRILNAAVPAAMTVAEIAAAIATHLDFRGEFLPVNDNSYPPTIGASPSCTFHSRYRRGRRIGLSARFNLSRGEQGNLRLADAYGAVELARGISWSRQIFPMSSSIMLPKTRFSNA